MRSLFISMEMRSCLKACDTTWSQSIGFNRVWVWPLLHDGFAGLRKANVKKLKIIITFYIKIREGLEIYSVSRKKHEAPESTKGNEALNITIISEAHFPCSKCSACWNSLSTFESCYFQKRPKADVSAVQRTGENAMMWFMLLILICKGISYPLWEAIHCLEMQSLSHGKSHIFR